ncbi:hypothetical protein BU24DRAFT_244965 [Aaosphaeria arxii CBS 175.79]|uniref:Uncharacterized protein n=1 Tax=Aaosphaeria arxii CBS 175.79 TaxID=1450172 RepID=A0A6A5XKQ8_9PLEO|nr:uncharacterized protein BU24DRAFT_244965 [Aaosphaeria arxii CBS 175.79]KAF2013722.1 hypothetical protein BU24DRAFT_244965 [Aaosphaeria arxii CBS 175.79]
MYTLIPIHRYVLHHRHLLLTVAIISGGASWTGLLVLLSAMTAFILSPYQILPWISDQVVLFLYTV